MKDRLSALSATTMTVRGGAGRDASIAGSPLYALSVLVT
jgi:hypothetical protein